MNMDSDEIERPEGLEVVSGRLRQQPARVTLLCGNSGVFTMSLLVASAAQSTRESGFAVLDGAMRFNSYTLSRIASSLGIVPKALLGRVYVTRSFTAFQTEEAITGKFPRFLDRTPSCRLMVILGLLDTYYDEQVKVRECRQSLRRVLERLHSFARKGIHVLIVDVDLPGIQPERKSFFPMIKNSADAVIKLDQHGLFLENASSTERRIQRWDETTIHSRLSSTPQKIRGGNTAGR
jgi:hypothetical protein